MQLFGNRKHLDTRTGFEGNEELRETVRLCSEGDRKAQKAVYDALSSKMFAICLRYMGEKEAAMDILQDGFVALFTKIGTYSGEGSFEGWARKIFVNSALMSLRKKDVLKNTEDVSAAWNITSGTPSAIQDMGYMELLRQVAALPPGFRTVFNLYVMEGYSHKDIAEELGISEATSRSQLQRARALLQSRIKKY